MSASISDDDIRFYHEAFLEAQSGLKEGGIPIGSVLVCDGKILGRGHNRRIQKSSAILHGEMDAIENAGRLSAHIYERCTLYTTLSPCSMCSGTSILYKIPRIVIGENKNFMGDEALLKSKGVELIVLQDKNTILLMEEFITKNPTLWNEDI
jgi:cytosine deaminase